MIQLEIIGRIGKGGETKQIGDKQAYCFSVASNEKQNGQKVTTWVDIVFFRVQSGLIQYLQQGSLVRVVGNPSWRIYTDKSGQNRVGITVYAGDINLLATPDSGQQQGYQQQVQQPNVPTAEQVKAAADAFYRGLGQPSQQPFVNPQQYQQTQSAQPQYTPTMTGGQQPVDNADLPF